MNRKHGLQRLASILGLILTGGVSVFAVPGFGVAAPARAVLTASAQDGASAALLFLDTLIRLFLERLLGGVF